MNPKEQLESLKGRIRGQQPERGNLVDNDDAIIEIHHIFMRQYGYISIKEFGEMPIPTMWNLLSYIRKEKEAEERESKKMRSKGMAGRMR